ncbi:hypothetical protein [Priestia endophytica]|uniref:hypothetical protein n=1 Tax=Priestia endophytica TaxID=135735 RepID=UPI00203FC4B8|nr:hypothetical protein [Priestia endophytica]MCM3536582.1 hypothetical protein [Priestia endophytica]
MVKEKQLNILKGLYNRMQEGTKVTNSSVGFEGRDGVHEAASYLTTLERQGLVEIGPKAFTTGGRRHEQYNNNVIMIWWEEVELTPLGKKEVEEN